MTSQNFAGLGVAAPFVRALDAAGLTVPTPIQAGTIPALLAGRDVLGVAQTGTGKTAAFALPILQHLAATPGRARPFGTRALILAPTRELAQQIEGEFRRFAAGSRLGTAVIVGGVGRRPQEERMRRGPDVVIGTPGRLCDLIGTRHLRLEEVRHFVLDEADRMLDMGFIRDIRRIASAVPAARQSLLFSATMPPPIAQLAAGFLRDPVRVAIAPEKPTPALIEQHVHFVETAAKRAHLTRLLEDAAMARVIVFTRTKHGADRVAEHLAAGGVATEALHGNKSQNARERSLDRFRSGRARVLVATDIAARGIDVSGISHVVNFDLPVEAESYVHRIGRTARAGASGIAISLCSGAERPSLRAIERLTGRALTAVGAVPAESTHHQAPPANRNRRRGGPSRGMRRAA
jgi:ATP-dependent RNA helicase RhlE